MFATKEAALKVASRWSCVAHCESAGSVCHSFLDDWGQIQHLSRILITLNNEKAATPGYAWLFFFTEIGALTRRQQHIHPLRCTVIDYIVLRLLESVLRCWMGASLAGSAHAELQRAKAPLLSPPVSFAHLL